MMAYIPRWREEAEVAVAGMACGPKRENKVSRPTIEEL